jgi:N-acetylmuramoyl-L-alanine amidase
VLPVVGLAPDDRFVVQTPCAVQATTEGAPISGATVVLDPGHGGEEVGAVGPSGLREADVNLVIAEEAARRLSARGARVVLTRTSDYRISLRTRALIGTALQPAAFVSIHHNAEPDGPWPGPGSETYYQIENADSKRLAGLLWEEYTSAFAVFEGVDWVADRDAGAKYRLTSRGTDYYGILSRTVGIDAVLSEAAFISNPDEEALLRTPAFQQAEAQAITDAVVRFVTTDDPGAGFVTPYPRTQPAGPGGGTEGCEDPPL